MKYRGSRRELLKGGLTMGAALALSPTLVEGDEVAAHAPLAAPPPEGAEFLTAYPYGGQILLRWNNHIVAAYRANPEQKYPYLGNLAGPASGLSLTTESSLPYPHHRGVWLGCDPLHGGDYWKDSSHDRGQVRTTRLEVLDQSPTAVSLANDCTWERPGQSALLDDSRTIKFHVVDEERRTIDFDITLTAKQDISIGKAKHSFFALRVAPDLAPQNGGTLVNAEGLVGEAETYGQPTRWCDYYGARAQRPDVVEGIAVMDHPENPWAPCPWFTRDYGHLSPSPFNFLGKKWQLANGESIRLRYRVVLHAGSPKEADLNGLWGDWVSVKA
ncbi:PmoA family protein [Aeoliella sp.]|uniref:DUF6807 domain-containing protein n=1 Tax=Aeoliella sp. TaxID=2795800 RepID=UPI003CCB9B07